MDFNAYSVFPRRATMMDTEENMMTRVTKPMRITTAISQRGDAYTETLDKQKSFFSHSTLFSVTICLLLLHLKTFSVNTCLESTACFYILALQKFTRYMSFLSR